MEGMSEPRRTRAEIPTALCAGSLAIAYLLIAQTKESLNVVTEIPADQYRLGPSCVGRRHRAEQSLQGRPVPPPDAAPYSSGNLSGKTAPALDHCQMGVPWGLA